MPVIEDRSYLPPLLFRIGHLNTLYPYIFRNIPKLDYQRERVNTPDDDFIDIDHLKSKNSRLAILCHGLEGSSTSKYILHTAKLLNDNGWDLLCMNYRGCSGEMNNKIVMYHSGFTQDLHMVVERYKSKYDSLALIGFSLGGNMVMKYMGDGHFTLSSKIKSCVGISVPCDLHAGSIQISEWQNFLYDHRFLVSLKEKIKLKKTMFPELVDLSLLKKVKTLFDFDDLYTAPIHGFQDAADYYSQCNCKQFLKNINTPSLIINAVDDPFLPDQSYPFEEAQKNENLFFIASRYGGHVGFVNFGNQPYWEEQQILNFINDPNIYN